MMPRSPTPRRRRGILLYVSLGLILTLSIGAFMLYEKSKWAEINAVFVYHSEAITNLAEAAIEEVFFNVKQRLNDKAGGNRLFDMLRKHWDPSKEGEPQRIDDEVMASFAAQSRKLGSTLYQIDPKDFEVKGRITRIEPFRIRGFNPADPIEKSGAFEVAVSITFNKGGAHELRKVMIASKPIKVVRTTMPVLAESTLFVNNLAATNFAEWESALGYDPQAYPNPSKTLTLDHGWAKYNKTNKKSDFIQKFEEEIIPKGRVPPGRVYIREGIVPLTNGDRAAGALQKTFFSAESELLPVFPPIPLKQLKEGLQNDEAAERARQEAAARQRQEGVEILGPDGESIESEPTTTSTSATGSTSIPDDGELIIRYLGAGLELIEDDVSKYLGGNEAQGYKTYFGALAEGPWKDKKPTRSGLDLFGRTTEKEPGKAMEGEGFFERLWNKVKEIGAKLLSKLYAKYNIKLSPTLVYGNVLQSYYMARDYAFTGWWENVKRTFGDKQIPIPYFPEGHLARLPPEEPMKKDDLPAAWDDKLKDRFMKLPEDIRKPSFVKTLDEWATDMNKRLAPILPESLRNELQNLPQGTIVAPYHVALRSFLQTAPDSKIDAFTAEYLKAAQAMASGQTPVSPAFLSNLVDRANPNLVGPYEAFFEADLSEFNPFLFYSKATEYISSLWDPRLPEDAPAEQKNVFLRKFRDKDDPSLLRLDGVIYITGTEDLMLKNFRYTGKALIITFGRIVFDGFFVKKQDSGTDPAKNDLLTIISLGGIVFNTSEPIHAQLYSYIYPFKVTAGHKLNVFGGLGCNDLMLEHLGDGGEVNYDWTYHIPPEELANKNSLDAMQYYHVAITDEISKFEYQVKRDVPELTPTEGPR